MSALIRLTAIKTRADAATEGAWWTEFWLDDLSWREGHYSVLAKKDDPVRIVDPNWETSEEQTKADGEFIAHARDDVPDMANALLELYDLHAPYDQCDEGCCRYCEECEQEWPCTTRTVIERNMGQSHE